MTSQCVVPSDGGNCDQIGQIDIMTDSLFVLNCYLEVNNYYNLVLK